MEDISSKLMWGTWILSSLIFIFLTTYLSATTIEDSLEGQGLRLVSKLVDKTDLYERSFKRGRNLLIGMNLDGFMSDGTLDDEGAIALGIWCDNELKKKHFFVSLEGYRRFCALSMGDVLWLEKNKFHEKVMEEESWLNHAKEVVGYDRFRNEFFSRFGLDWEDDYKRNYLTWKNWCEWELSEPYSLKNIDIRNIIRDNCLDPSEAENLEKRF
ncbi:hypothetical protein HF1_04980 [Mycoplasma haemofelis str. Langford 1]|uniref:Uncharacterized protein n=1 Tax=Mycoplasma haemofelis (strain Langford 1) TaxID=941640 RepID=E8ZH85_MYCHL|nr:hypothetical protein HF1_04980 [Mycoplasma haemofelis str. Langford 1]